eukprot:gb/GFBE01070437.1/.p2 GENE.gb/GFBE01070437.1/~~gb/GFBE01070437.1/.p2  ORF type:complete len:160 (-),score=21.60 gb/GFBE01070437.1/:425-904(-)
MSGLLALPPLGGAAEARWRQLDFCGYLPALVVKPLQQASHAPPLHRSRLGPECQRFRQSGRNGWEPAFRGVMWIAMRCCCVESGDRKAVQLGCCVLRNVMCCCCALEYGKLDLAVAADLFAAMVMANLAVEVNLAANLAAVLDLLVLTVGLADWHRSQM